MTETPNSNQLPFISIPVLLTQEDVTEAYWRYRRERELVTSMLQSIIVSIFVGVLAAFGVCCKFVVMGGIWPFIGLFLAVVVLIGIPVGTHKTRIWVERTSYYYVSRPFYHKPLSFDFNKIGLVVRGADESYPLPWSSVFEVYELPSMFIVVTDEKFVLPLPKRFCSGSDQVLEITKILRENVKEYSVLKGKNIDLVYGVSAGRAHS